jgi:hypothetical protein
MGYQVGNAMGKQPGRLGLVGSAYSLRIIDSRHVNTLKTPLSGLIIITHLFGHDHGRHT